MKNRIVNNSIEKKEIQINILNDEVEKEDMLIDAYIGKKTDRLKNRGFSWCAFFFGPYYFLYRKMWMFGIILFIIEIVVGKIPDMFTWIKLIINVIIRIMVAIIFSEEYLSFVMKKVKKIISDNDNKNYEKIMLICKKKGGTSMLPIVLIGIFLISIGILIYEINESYNEIKDKYNEIKKSEIISPTEFTR